MERIALYNDSFQNWKSHNISKAQLILTDIPYQLGTNAYGSNCSRRYFCAGRTRRKETEDT